MLEVRFELDGICIKKITMWHDKDKTIVQILELREDNYGKSGWYPVHLNIHSVFFNARVEFMGLINSITYENANNIQETDRENIFQRGSLPSSFVKKIK